MFVSLLVCHNSGASMGLEASNPVYYAKIGKLLLFNILKDSIRGPRSIRTLGSLGVGAK